MKKFPYPIIFFLLLVSCTYNNDFSEDLLESKDISTLPQKNSIRSIDEAIAITMHSLPLIERGSTRAGGILKRKINVKEGVKTIVSNNTTRSLIGDNDTLMYVLNFEDNEGFAVIAAPNSVEGLLAITESGHFEPGTSSDNEGFEMFMELAEKYVRQRIHEPIIHLVDSVIYVGELDYGPYVSVRWGQTLPEGEFCPNNIAGCTNTALAQIMSYYEYPNRIDLTYPNADKTSQLLNWSSMKVHQTEHNLNNCATTDSATHASIGRLCRQLGYLNHSDYMDDGTGTYTQIYVAQTMASLGFQTGSWFSYNTGLIENNILSGIPMLIKGARYGENNNLIGHAWVLDGYNIITYQYCTIAHLYGTGETWIDSLGDVFTETLYHFNWGFYGVNNGYFDAYVFNTASVQYPDTNLNYYMRNYQYDISLIPIWQ